MLEFEINVRTAADQLLYEGLPLLQPALQKLDRGALLIGGLSVAAWIAAHPVAFPARATRDVDLGIDRQALGIGRDRAVVGPLLRALDFRPGYDDEAFRFAHQTTVGHFVVDLLVARGASRSEPPIVEAGMASVAAPGLAYAFRRGAVPLRVVLNGEQRIEIAMHTVTLDAALVMKAALVAGGLRARADRRITDTTDAVLLAAAAVHQTDALQALHEHRRHGEVKVALRWLAESFDSPRSAMPRRLADHFADPAAAEWTVDAAAALSAAVNRRRGPHGR